MDSISKFNPEKIKLIMEDELKKLLRPDLSSLLDEMINEFEKNNLNYSFLIEQAVLKQNKLLSVKELYNELINDEKQNFTIAESYFWKLYE